MTEAPGAASTRPCVLVTDGVPSGQSRSSLAAVRALHTAGYRVVVTVSGRHSLAAASRCCWSSVRVPAADDPAYARHVVALAEELGAVETMPSSDAALLALDAPGAHLVDKTVLTARAEAVGLRRPASRVFASGAALVDLRHEIPLPGVVKVARKDHVTGRAAHVVRHHDDLLPWEPVADPVVVEELLDGPMTAVFGLVSGGDLHAVGMQRYLRTWPTECGVGCAAQSVAPDAGLVDLVVALLADYDGIFQAQFVQGHLIDLNPRVYGSLPLALRAGVNLPGRWCDLRTGRVAPAPVQARAGAHYRWIEGEVRWAAATLGQGGLRAVTGVARPRRGTIHSVWALRDPAPFLARLVHALSRPPAENVVVGGCNAPAGTWGLTPREEDLVAMPGGLDATVPEPDLAGRRLRAADLVRPIAEDLGATVRQGVLGPAWSSDIDVHLAPGSRDASTLLASHPRLLPMDALLRRLGSSAVGQWAVHENGHALGRFDVHEEPVRDVVERLEVRLRSGNAGTRQVLELRRLGDAPPALPASVRRRLARREARLGGGLLQRSDGARVGQGFGGDLTLRRPRVRRRRVVVALSGLDGAGKSSQVARLRSSLEALGVPVAVAWERPGMGLQWLAPLRRAIKRLMGQDTEPGVRAVGRGDERLPATRRGVLGTLWVSLVVLSYLARVRRRGRLRRGVVLHDRHLLDAVATVEAVYGDALMPWQRRLLVAGHPRADLTILLQVPLETAAVRKPDAVFSRHLLALQQRVYEQASAVVPGVVVLDGTRPADVVASEVLGRVLGIPS